MESENKILQQKLQDQKAKILQKIKKKYKEYLVTLQNSFLLERQKIELQFEKKTAENLEALKSKCKLRYICQLYLQYKF